MKVDCCIVVVVVDPLRWSFADCRIIDAAAAIVDWIASILLKLAVVYPFEYCGVDCCVWP